MVVSEVLEHTASGLGALKFKGEIDLKNHLYRPIQKFVSLLALIFDKQLRPHKNSIDRLVELSNQGLLDKQLASPLIEALEWIMSVRLDRHTKKNSAADKLPCVELDKQKLELAVKVLTAIQERLNSYKQNRDAKVFLPPPSVPKKKFFFF
jgi:signal-transduction protein with cAMP-binding, CBS, and nucleotidyltransferase domain